MLKGFYKESFEGSHCYKLKHRQILRGGKKIEYNIHSIKDTVALIRQNGASLMRFGDGELDIIKGKSIPYQKYEKQLAIELKEILAKPSKADFLIGIPDVFRQLERYNLEAQNFWLEHRMEYESYLTSDWYVTAFISRPYIDLANKAEAAISFNQIKSIWKGKDLLIVEGVTSRSGVGNDLFSEANSVSRLICPAQNAYDKLEEILCSIKMHGENRLILIMLGPTAKVLVYRLYQEQYQALDIGHIDSEYEWFKMEAHHKVKLLHKHTAEYNYDEGIIFEEDLSYENSILERIL